MQPSTHSRNCFPLQRIRCQAAAISSFRLKLHRGRDAKVRQVYVLVLPHKLVCSTYKLKCIRVETQPLLHLRRCSTDASTVLESHPADSSAWRAGGGSSAAGVLIAAAAAHAELRLQLCLPLLLLFCHRKHCKELPLLQYAGFQIKTQYIVDARGRSGTPSWAPGSGEACSRSSARVVARDADRLPRAKGALRRSRSALALRCTKLKMSASEPASGAGPTSAAAADASTAAGTPSTAASVR